MSAAYRFLALSDHRMARGVRRVYRQIRGFSVPAPRVVAGPALSVVLSVKAAYYFLARVFFCEPLFKAHCAGYGRNSHTGAFLHWVQGRGDLIVGDNVTIDGRCNFFFAARYTEQPRLTIGDHTGIGHNCAFVVGRSISIGRHCRIGSSVQMFDSPGHPSDPTDRLAGLPARLEDVRPIELGDNVWIGSSSIIFPGVTIGEGSVVATGSVVMNGVPPNVVVAGNPARQVAALRTLTPGGA
jgi:acetyltransferase-like isoleucine patch superfamily enzyme